MAMCDMGLKRRINAKNHMNELMKKNFAEFDLKLERKSKGKVFVCDNFQFWQVMIQPTYH